MTSQQRAAIRGRTIVSPLSLKQREERAQREIRNSKRAEVRKAIAQLRWHFADLESANGLVPANSSLLTIGEIMEQVGKDESV